MISIPKPCHEDWNRMTPKEQGRLCDKCCKVVIDFTAKTTGQIVEFLQLNAGKKVCGHFRTEQVTVPAVSAGRLPRRRIFLAALWFVFGSLLFTSCENREKQYVAGTVAQLVDTPQHRDHIRGKVKCTPPDTTAKKPVKKTVARRPPPADTVEPPMLIRGEVMYVPADTTGNQ